MAYVIDIFGAGRGRLLVVEGDGGSPARHAGAGLRAAGRGGRAGQGVGRGLAINQLKPAINAVTDRLKVFAADEMAVEFGIVLGAEAGAIIAKGTADVHFTVTLNWKRSGERPASGEQAPAGQGSGEGQKGV